MAQEKVPRSAYISWNKDECTACSRCLMACATYHWGAVSKDLSAIKWVDDDFLHGPHGHPVFCSQCNRADCYLACPSKDIALCIDSATGARYINKDECSGCGMCIEACPFKPARISFNKKDFIAIKCDLCRGRPGGPACVELCDRKALTLVTRGEK